MAARAQAGGVRVHACASIAYAFDLCVCLHVNVVSYPCCELPEVIRQAPVWDGGHCAHPLVGLGTEASRRRTLRARTPR